MSNAKRRRLGLYKALDVNSQVRDNNPDKDVYYGSVSIPYTRSTEWGSPALSAARVLVEDATDENAVLIRSYHPAFADTAHTQVELLLWRDGTRINYGTPPARIFWCMGTDMVSHAIDPRRILAEGDLEGLRMMYPRACGVRVWLSSVVQMLYHSRSNLCSDQARPNPHVAGGRPVVFDVLHCEPSADAVHSDQPVAQLPHASLATCSVGLRLLLPDRHPAITTVAHGFVRAAGVSGPGLGRLRVLSDLFWAAKDALSRFRSPVPCNRELPIVRPEQSPTSNTALGKDVFLAGSSTRQQYPARHDLHHVRRARQFLPVPVGVPARPVPDFGRHTATHRSAKALVFQNFETRCETGASTLSGRRETVNTKGGFLLPTFVYNECVLHHDTDVPDVTKLSTVPRARGSIDAGRQSFSGPQ